MTDRHLGLFKDRLEGEGSPDLEYTVKELLMLCCMCYSAGMESLFDELYMMALQKVSIDSWVDLWLVSEAQPNESYYREQLT